MPATHHRLCHDERARAGVEVSDPQPGGHDGKIITGWAAVAEREDELPALVDALNESRGLASPL